MRQKPLALLLQLRELRLQRREAARRHIVRVRALRALRQLLGRNIGIRFLDKGSAHDSSMGPPGPRSKRIIDEGLLRAGGSG